MEKDGGSAWSQFCTWSTNPMFGHVKRGNEKDTFKDVRFLKYMGKRLRGIPFKRWLDEMNEILKKIGVQEWKTIVQERYKWRKIVMVVKTQYHYKRRKLNPKI